MNTKPPASRNHIPPAVQLANDRCRCGLRLPCNQCLHASGADRDAGKAQWWSKRTANHKYTDEETRCSTAS